MISPIFKFLVKPKRQQRYDRETEIGDKKVIQHTTIDEKDFKFVNREATVISTPITETPVKVGMDVIIHYNCFRRYWGFDTKLKNGDAFFKDGMFLVEPDELFLYRNPGEPWSAFDRFCFITPIEKEKGLFNTFDDEEEHIGVIEHTNDGLKSLGINNGDVVSFKDYPKFEFNVEGKKMYKMNTDFITCKIL